MITTTRDVTEVPDEIARRIVLPEGHTDEEALYEAYAWLRNNAPVAKVHVEGYDPLWLVSKHADIIEIGRHPEIFTNAGGDGSHNPILQNQAGDEFTRQLTGGSLRVAHTSVFYDPPEIYQIRDIAVPSLRPGALKGWEDRIRNLAREAIDSQLTLGINEIDIVKDFCLLYPLRVIMTIVGFPPEDEPRMLSLTQEFFGTTDPETRREDIPESPEAAARQFWETIKGFYEYFDVVIDDRLENPRDDLATVISTAKHPETGEPWPREITWGWFINLANAGHDTTSSTLASIFEALATHPDQFERVKAHPELIRSLVNEGIRWASVAKHFMRQASADYELRGQQIKAGDRLMMLYQSANRDEDVFDAPTEFRLDRADNNHLTFGFGPHVCPGQNLARQELRIMLEELLPRLKSMEVIGPRKVVETNFIGGLRRLPMRLVLD